MVRSRANERPHRKWVRSPLSGHIESRIYAGKIVFGETTRSVRFNESRMASQIVVGSFKRSALAPRGCLVRVTSATKAEKWFAVGVQFHQISQTAVYDIPPIEPTV